MTSPSGLAPDLDLFLEFHGQHVPVEVAATEYTAHGDCRRGRCPHGVLLERCNMAADAEVGDGLAFIAPVPEPPTLLVVASGLVGARVARRARRPRRPVAPGRPPIVRRPGRLRASLARDG